MSISLYKHTNIVQLINHTNIFMNKLYSLVTRVSTRISYIHWTS